MGASSASESGGTGSLSIALGGKARALTLVPAISMDIASYTVSASGENGGSFTVETTGDSVTKSGLSFGTWTIVVNALNSSGTLIGTGTATAEVSAGAETAVSVTVTPVDGTGCLKLELSWPSGTVQSPAIAATLTPALGSARNLAFTIEGAKATFSSSEIGSGYYTLSVALKESGTVVAGAVEVVRIVADQTTSGIYEFTSVNSVGGSLTVSMDADMENPLDVGICGAFDSQVVGSARDLSAGTSGYDGNVVYAWYVNGSCVATGSTYSFGPGLAVGDYRVDVVAFAADGSRAGSASTSIAVESVLIIGHRGSTGYQPEHSLGGYELAIKLGVDVIEPDLYTTSDGVLVAMHDSSLARTTNVESLFEARNGSYKVTDFTLAEIKTLTVEFTGTSAKYSSFVPSVADPYRVPTFQEVIDFAKAQSEKTGRTISIYPEIKAGDSVQARAILDMLKANGYSSASDGVFIQCFNADTIREVNAIQEAEGTSMRLIVLGAAIMDNGVAKMGVKPYSASTALSLADVASFADGIGVTINSSSLPVTAEFIKQAHAVGLKVHLWTFQTEEDSTAAAEYATYLAMGMDGMFTNYPDLAVEARDEYQGSL